MRTALRLSALVFAVLSLVAAAWWVRRAPNDVDTATTARDERRAILPMGSPSDFFTSEAVGDAVIDKKPPQISNVQVVDLDGDGLPDILVCDVIRGQVTHPGVASTFGLACVAPGEALRAKAKA